MNKSKSIIASALILGATTLLANNGVENRCIVQFNDDVPSSMVKGLAKGLAQKGNSTIEHTYEKAIKGMAINMPCFAAEAAFGRDENIKSMQPDYAVYATAPGGGKGKPKDSTPDDGTTNPDDGTTTNEPEIVLQPADWGVEKVGSYDGTGKTAWIIDSGIDLDHVELNVDESRAYTLFRKADDDNGHGTHVAGIIGALNNDIGTVGVAYNASVVPVKVLDRNGSGSASGVLAGLNAIADKIQPGDCVNLSLGGTVPTDTSSQEYEDTTALENAIINLADEKKAYFVLAAGNDTDDSSNYSPARIDGEYVYTVSAIDEYDNFAEFSNYGSSVDFAAPGVNIKSTFYRNSLATGNGTSQTAPHVCAALMLQGTEITNDNGEIEILKITTQGNAINDPDGITGDPIIKIISEPKPIIQ